MTANPPTSLRSSLVVSLLLVVATSLVFWPGLNGGFLFDDYPNLVHNDRWRIALQDTGGWLRLISSDISGPIGRPLALVTFAINFALAGMSPFWFKLTGLGLHALNGILVWRFCRGLFGDLPITARPTHWAAVATALAWLLHPVQPSSVLYIVQRMELGAATGVLLSLLAYQHARRAQLAGTRAWPWLLAWPVAVLFGLGFKESALLAPGFAFLLEVCVFNFAGPVPVRRAWRIFWVFVGVSALVVFGAATWWYAGSAAWGYRDFSMPERLMTESRVLSMYLGQLLLPRPDAFSFYYDDLSPSRGLFSPATTIACGTAIVALCTGAIWTRRRWPLMAFGVGWFFLAHALTATVVPLELAFEHRNYLALLGILLAVVPLVDTAARSLSTKVRRLLSVLVLGSLALLCMLQAATWGDPVRLASTLALRNPQSPRAAYALGTHLLAASGSESRSPAWMAAEAEFERAAALPRASALPLQAILIMRSRAGLAIPDASWARFREVLLRRPFDADAATAMYGVSKCAIDGRCVLDDRELLKTFTALLRQYPTEATLHTLYADFAWNRLQDPILAIGLQRRAVALSKGGALERIALAQLLTASGIPANISEGILIGKDVRVQDRTGRYDRNLDKLDELLR